MKETDLGRYAKAWLEELDLEVFQEVEFQNGRIDLVGRRHRKLVAIEVKMSFGLDVIAQAYRWLDYAHESWVCILAAKRPQELQTRQLAMKLCEVEQIGVLMLPWLNCQQRWADELRVMVPVVPQPPIDSTLHSALHPEQKGAAPAGSRGGHSTAWKRWAERFRMYVRHNSGCRLKEAIEESAPYFCATAYSRLRLVQGKLQQDKRPQELAGVRLSGRGAKATVDWIDEGTF